MSRDISSSCGRSDRLLPSSSISRPARSRPGCGHGLHPRRVSDGVDLKVEDYYPQKKRYWLRLREKNGKINKMRCHHKLDAYLAQRYLVHDPAARDRCPIKTATGRHTFRARGITDYLTNGGKLEVAQRMAGYSNAKITGPYDRKADDISVSEVERVGI